MTTVKMIEGLMVRVDRTDPAIDLMIGSLLLHAKADAARVAELENLLKAAYEALGSSGWSRGDDPLMDHIHAALNLPD